MNQDNQEIAYDKWTIQVNAQSKLIYLSIHDNMNIEVEDIHEMVNAQQTLCNNTAEYSRLLLAGLHANISSDARSLLQKVELPVKKEAYVISGLAQKLIVNFYIKFRPNKHPFRAFNKEKDALEWLGIVVKR